MKRKLTGVLLILSILFPQARLVTAQDLELDQGFDPNVILTDEDVFDAGAMSFDRLVGFLKTKGTLAEYRTTDIDGTTRTAPEIIWRVANSYKINPKFLVALLQKEQSLVEDATPSQGQYDWAAGFGVCDDCSKDDPALSDFKGFANQMEYAAKQMRERYYMRLLSNGQTRSGYAPGKTTVIDGLAVTPANLATASLYTYTPHIHGNLNLWRIWKRWFSKHYPDGTVVRGAPSGALWWIRLGLKRPFASKAVATTLVDISKVVDVSDTDLASYEEGTAINFPNYALLRDPAGRIWLLSGNERRHVKNMKTFQTFGFNMDEVEDVNDEDLTPYDIGRAITLEAKYPQGMLLQDTTTKEVWYAEAGERQLVQHASLLSLYFKNRKPKKVTSLAIADLTKGEPYRLHDGELVKSSKSSAVYVIESGKRRPIPSAEAFETLGWKWKNVVTLPTSVLDDYPVSDPVLLDAPPVALVQAE
ncbi:hypothetical protein A3E39_02550 [Candidatus Uhrbacteria bacterium RIFCSPHIGHO2_12_FULL_60_25]|uniref:Uncharacterized protein n=1 Tax=Candidatus Uhrbacteria bacterium RIFCSPHIGHO2_12_FULL_60_25 TaxID=1802399 RepID=A0A1F7ULF8_9BACT|nr:MAG: hypothetical protein A3D73_03625 [Candidatus Uhrbacteria bacterium RIFCSPHIGHO2_02_FULL_60_44]OGL79101.1 MAG: hypothetical protein A3E39_02550 [Candidatus Uhrbacteria bacterium RIFCSPHIGHO2_12_FULL_60_25]